MLDERSRANVSETAHLAAAIRALGRRSDGEHANGDYLADRFLLPSQRSLLWAPRLSRWVIDRFVPGGYGYFNARTRYFDAVLEQEAAQGLDQLVVLGVGYDTRSLRFAAQLKAARVFEVDRAEVLATRAQRLAAVSPNPLVTSVAIDFEQDDLQHVLRSHGFVTHGARSLFLWEGVTLYLPEAAVDQVLASVASLTETGSSIVFDYVTRSFWQGDVSGYGAAPLAEAWRRMGNVNRSGVASVLTLVSPHNFRVLEEVGPAELERRYLQQLPGGPRKTWGVLRIAHCARN